MPGLWALVGSLGVVGAFAGLAGGLWALVGSLGVGGAFAGLVGAFAGLASACALLLVDDASKKSTASRR